jgi:hypothetical protein
LILALALIPFATHLSAQSSSGDTLTAEGLRAWLQSGGAFDSMHRQIHEQMQQQKVKLPPWWPDDVFQQEEDAVLNVDFVDAALPFYQACLSDSQARLLAKISATDAGKQVSHTALQTHSQAAEHGSSAVEAQAAGEDAAGHAAESITAKQRDQMVASLTPAERALAAKEFAPEKLASLRQCTDHAYAQTIGVLGSRQQAAVHAVIEANRPKLVEAKTQWAKDHPGAQ